MNRKTLSAVAFILAVALAAIVWNGASASARNAEPVAAQGGCTAITVTNIASQGVAANQGEKITVNWSFTPPAGVGGPCVKVDGFKVKIVVKRRNGNTDQRNLDASATAREASATFAESIVNSPIESATVTVTAEFSGNAFTAKTQGL